MKNEVWKVYVDYGEGYGWVPVRWAPTFDTQAEANEWISGDHDWESPVRAFPKEVEDEDEDEEDNSDNEPDGSWMDADALASAGHGTDEDYGYYGDE